MSTAAAPCAASRARSAPFTTSGEVSSTPTSTLGPSGGYPRQRSPASTAARAFRAVAPHRRPRAPDLGGDQDVPGAQPLVQRGRRTPPPRARRRTRAAGGGRGSRRPRRAPGRDRAATARAS
ncbi:hypothetical protein, partial [Actinomadura sp. CNU-125]|uniref:hypothetical protein n=1 Tax=Actinomadura sp. CNU-125 TaxID=1904961 RepID=UPI0021CCAC72